VSRFTTDTIVESLGGGEYRVRVDPGWWIVNGPNGGYVAALVLRAPVEGICGSKKRNLRFLQKRRKMHRHAVDPDNDFTFGDQGS
jgi:hypothetical protein